MKHNVLQLTKPILAVGSCLILTAQTSVPCIASAMTKEELADKYAAELSMWTEYGLLCDGGPDCTVTDENGVGTNGIDYGAELANRTLYLYGDNCVWDETSCKPVYIGEYETFDHFYCVQNSDGTLCIVGADCNYFAKHQIEKLSIPSELNEIPVTELGEGSFMDFKCFVPTLRSITVPDSIAVIRRYAFCNAFGAQPYGCSINVPEHVVQLGAFCYGQLGNALGNRTALPETLEYIDYSAFGTATYTEVILPESNVVCLPGCVQYRANPNEQTAVARFGENCVTADDSVFSSEVIEEALEEAENRREKFAEIKGAVMTGDLDEDGEVDVLDGVMLARLIVEDLTLDITETGRKNADINADGTVKHDDLTALLKFLAQ